MKSTLCMLLCMLLFAACTPTTPQATDNIGQNPPPPPPSATPGVARISGPPIIDGIREIKWLIPVLLEEKDYKAAVERVSDILSQVNPRLEDVGMQLSIELRQVVLYEMDTMYLREFRMKDDIVGALNSGEWFDLISVPANMVTVTELIDLGLIKEISLDIESYSNLRRAIDKNRLSSTYYKNGLYGVPTGYDAEKGLKKNYLAVNREALDAMGISELKTTADILEAAAQARLQSLPHDVYYEREALAFWRDYPQFPFKVSEDKLFIFHHDGSIEPYIDSDIFWQDFALSNALAANLSQAKRDERAFFEDPSRSIPLGKLGEPYDFVDRLYDVRDYDDYITLKLAPDKPMIITGNPFGKIYNIVPEKCDEPHGLKLLDWLYENPDVYMLLGDTKQLIGGNPNREMDEGHPASRVYYDWPLDAQSRIDYAPEGLAFLLSDYCYSLFDCIKQTSFTDYEQVQFETLRTVYADRDFEAMPWDGFVFNGTSIPTADGTIDITGKNSALETPAGFLGLGMISVSDIAEAKNNMYNAGYEAVLEECRRQYADFQKNKGAGW